MTVMGVTFVVLCRNMQLGERGHVLDGTIVCINDMFSADVENHSMRHLYFHNHGYACANVLNFSHNSIMLRLSFNC
jgi:hypothetical protein